MIRTGTIVLGLGLLLATAAPLQAFPQFLQIFQSDPLRRADVDGCGTCHVNPDGGGPRNEFGQAFAASQMQITPLLRAQFPDRFAYPTTEISPGNVIHFADARNATIVLEFEGERYLVDPGARTVPGLDAASLTTPASQGERVSTEAVGPADPATQEGAFFGPRIVNLPNGKGLAQGNVEFLIGHRFTQPVFTRSSPASLFNFDSPAFVTFGGEVGLTDWLSVSAMRSNLDRTVELASGFQFSSQNEGSSAPVSTRLRMGIEGRDNFREQFAPFAQLVVARSFGDRFSLAAVPGIAFNTRDDARASLLGSIPGNFVFGADKDYTASLGVGAGLRVLPSVSLVAEYVPRWGFRGFAVDGGNMDRPAVSIGIQKATYRHTFEFVISTARPLTTAQYTVNGSGTFKVGFNIYRRLR